MRYETSVRVVQRLYGCMYVLFFGSLAVLVLYKLYLGPYMKSYEVRLKMYDEARNKLEMPNSICLPENIVRTGSVEICNEARRILNNYVSAGAAWDLMERMNVFSWIFGWYGEGYNVISPDQLLRLVPTIFIALAVLWIFSFCSVIVAGHQNSAAKWEMPLYTGKNVAYGPTMGSKTAT